MDASSTTNLLILAAVGFFMMASAVGMWVAIRLVRAGAPLLRQSQIPTLRAISGADIAESPDSLRPPSIPSEFARGTWRAL